MPWRATIHPWASIAAKWKISEREVVKHVFPNQWTSEGLVWHPMEANHE
jgi:hypothetical protein